MSINNNGNINTGRFDDDLYFRRAKELNEDVDRINIGAVTDRVTQLRNDVDDNNFVVTTNEDDVIATGAGIDSVISGNGNDIIVAGDGDDIVQGRNGSDILYGDAGNDRVYGGNDADYINTGSGNDQAFGGNGDDFIVAGIGNNWVEGGTGTDTVVFEGSSDDYLLGFDDDGNIVVTDALRPENKTTTTQIENYLFISDNGEELYTQEEIAEAIDFEAEEVIEPEQVIEPESEENTAQEDAFTTNHKHNFDTVWDLNGDGSLDTTEMKHFGWDPEAWSEHVARNDADGDNKLNFEETMEMWKEFDDNQDGLID